MQDTASFPSSAAKIYNCSRFARSCRALSGVLLETRAPRTRVSSAIDLIPASVCRSLMAERVGFEPTNGGRPLHDFESCAFIPSATSPVRFRCYLSNLSGICAGAPGLIRTGDLQLRRLLLYPSELRGRGLIGWLCSPDTDWVARRRSKTAQPCTNPTGDSDATLRDCNRAYPRPGRQRCEA